MCVLNEERMTWQAQTGAYVVYPNFSGSAPVTSRQCKDIAGMQEVQIQLMGTMKVRFALN